MADSFLSFFLSFFLGHFEYIIYLILQNVVNKSVTQTQVVCLGVIYRPLFHSNTNYKSLQSTFS